MKKNDKKAFTLAEALLTITIIGITTALMMRGISRVNPDKEKILFVKTFHAIEHVVANTINDPSRYDQNVYTDADFEGLGLTAEEIEKEKKNLHTDFSHAPLEDAIATVNGKTVKTCVKATSGGCLRQDTAVCYFLADGLNTSGTVNCENQNGVQIKTTTGVCLNHLFYQKVDNEYTWAFRIDPLCGKVSDGYEVLVYKDGKMTVPEKPLLTTTNKDNQKTAYAWMQSQTQVK